MTKKETKSTHKSKQSLGRVVWEYAKAIAFALFIALIIRSSVVSAYVIPSGSMEETLLIGDQIMVSKFDYGIKAPFTDFILVPVHAVERGDIIVFLQQQAGEDYIKRVIGLPGDKVQIIDKEVFVNDQRLDEPYAVHGDPMILPEGSQPRDNFGPIMVPEDKFFVMGDNRDYSFDSRFWGFVDRRDIRGKAHYCLWSWDSARFNMRWSRLFSKLN